MRNWIQLAGLLYCFFFLNNQVNAQRQVNYDETRVPAYSLPDPLGLPDGNPVRGMNEWVHERRPQIVRAFEHEMYGKMPDQQLTPTYTVLEESDTAIHGLAVRRQVEITFENNGHRLKMLLLVYLPRGNEQAPLFVGLNFYGNQTITTDPAVLLTTSWVPNNTEFGIQDNHASEASRGVRISRWTVEKIISAGYGLATMYYGDIDPDRDDFTDGVHPLFYRKGQMRPDADEWGAIGAWAWGLMRIMDYLQQDSRVDPSRIVLMGHSRLGKAALWAGALDPRYAIVISNDSGCGGAALSRRKYGETVQTINTAFPHWFCTNFKQYGDHEADLPVDQHELIALIAPRPVYIASAQEDQWADPKGEYLSGLHASPVYALFGLLGLESATPPAVNDPVMHDIGYHIRTGGHDVKDYDWEQYILFADMHFKRK
ncbi:MAG: hypothetical protein KDC28_00065 [Saprospiraceae bacterium]|nr:hypothetical protein [Saprospiraceae bacterium]